MFLYILHYTCSLCRFWQFNYIFWLIEMLDQPRTQALLPTPGAPYEVDAGLAVLPLFWPLNAKIRETCSSADQRTVYSLYCDCWTSQYRSPTVITLSNCSSVTPVNTNNHLKSIMSLAALLRITGNSCDSNPTNTSIALLFNASSVLTLIQ